MAEPWMDAAVAAQRAWVATPFEERRGIVGAFLDAVHGGESERFAVLLAEEARLPVREARYQIRTRLSAVVALYACPRPRDGTSGDGTSRDGVAVVERARGVVLLEVGPDEALLTFARAACRALVAGNAVVVVSSSPAVSAALALFGQVLDSRAPPGLAGLAVSAAAAPADGRVARTFSDFSGASARALPLVDVGHHVALVLPGVGDADALGAAVFRAIGPLRFQARDAVKRVYVHARDRDAVVGALGRALSARESASLPSKAQLTALKRLRTDALARGAALVHGRPCPPDAPYAFTPVLVVDAPSDALVAAAPDRWAGPLVAVFSYDDLDAAVGGLGAAARVSVWGDEKDAAAAALTVPAKTVCANDHASPNGDFVGAGLAPYLKTTRVYGPSFKEPNPTRKRPPIPACVAVIPALLAILWVGGFSQLLSPVALDTAFPGASPRSTPARRRRGEGARGGARSGFLGRG